MGKLVVLAKFWVTAMVVSMLRTTCHHPPAQTQCRLTAANMTTGDWRRRPLTRDEDGLSGSLQDLQRSELLGPGGLLGPGVDHAEPGDGLILLVPTVLSGHLDELSWCVGGKQAPALVTLDQSIPGAGAQWVDVNAGTRAGWAHHEPPGAEGGSAALVGKTK